MKTSAESEGFPIRVPACDNCRARKTKCDRKTPCSGCIATQAPCRVTRKAPEKRQRVLLSTKYNEAMENVNRQLQEVSSNLQILMDSNEQRDRQPPTQNISAHGSPSHLLNEQAQNLADVNEGYQGDSSFNAHVKHVADALEATYSKLSLSESEAKPHMSSLAVRELLQDVGTVENTSIELGASATEHLQRLHPALETLTLPPIEPVLKILRLARSEKQYFFVDYPPINEVEFTEMCRNVYFATEPYKVPTWIVVNTGLFYLLAGLEKRNYSYVGISSNDVSANIKLLTTNIDATIHSLKLCLEPSLPACESVALLGMFCLETGRSAFAWRLMTAAARMCLDLGYHRLPHGKKGREASKKRLLFWLVYSLDKGLAFTLGRTPNIHHYDVTSDWPFVPEDVSGTAGTLYATFIEYAVTAGDIHLQLFSASAQQDPQNLKVEHAKAFAVRLIRLKNSLEKYQADDTPEDIRFLALTVDVSLDCLLATVYRVTPPQGQNVHPLQCSDECVAVSRTALKTMLEIGEKLQKTDEALAWIMFVNWILSLSPFVSFLALVGNAIATSSPADLTLLSSVVSIMKPVGETSPSTRKLLDVCQKFCQIAEITITQNEATTSRHAANLDTDQVVSKATVGGYQDSAYGSCEQMDTSIDSSLPMSQQDWAGFIKDFELGLGPVNAGAMANLMEPYMQT